MPSSVQIVQADLNNPQHQASVLRLVDAYSMDAFGDGKPLATNVRERLIEGLQRHPTTLIWLAFDNGDAVGVAVCFLGFSTFAARPLINIHDCAVLPTHRGRGIGRSLLEAVERKGRELGCCKLTLEVQERNERARRTYTTAGFAQDVHLDDAGGALFMSKPLLTAETER